MYVRLDDIESRTFSWGRLVARHCSPATPGRRSTATSASATRCARSARSSPQYPELRASVRNLTSFRQGAPVDIDFAVTGPDLETLADFSRQASRQSRRRCRAWSTSTTRSAWTSRTCWPTSTASGPRRWASTSSEIADTLRIAVGGDDRVSRYYDAGADDAYDVELRLVGVDRGRSRSRSRSSTSAPMQPATDGRRRAAARSRRRCR